VFIAIFNNADSFLKAHEGGWFPQWLGGVILCYSYYVSGSIIVPICIHFIWNACTIGGGIFLDRWFPLCVLSRTGTSNEAGERVAEGGLISRVRELFVKDGGSGVNWQGSGYIKRLRDGGSMDGATPYNGLRARFVKEAVTGQVRDARLSWSLMRFIRRQSSNEPPGEGAQWVSWEDSFGAFAEFVLERYSGKIVEVGVGDRFFTAQRLAVPGNTVIATDVYNAVQVFERVRIVRDPLCRFTIISRTSLILSAASYAEMCHIWLKRRCASARSDHSAFGVGRGLCGLA
jgi:hypothetical protein